MRRSSAKVLLLVAAGSMACVVRLDDEFLPDGETNPAYVGGGGGNDGGSGQPDVADGCALLPTVPGVVALAGDSRSLPAADGGGLWIVDQAVTEDGGLVSPAAIVVATATSSGCTGWSATLAGAATAPSPLVDGGVLVALDPVEASSGTALYYEAFASDPSAPFGLRALGYGVALGTGAGSFVPTAELLWSADRPNYGGSALRVGDTGYVWGCKSTDAFDADCFVARASADSLASASAYSYWNGETWSPNPDDATPIASAGGVVSVRPDPSRAGRLLMTYVPPLGGTLVVRSAPAPEGPWSAPVTLASCDLSDLGAGSFCSGGQQHPELAPGSPALALTYDARSFNPEAGSPAAFWPRLATFPVPVGLP